MSEESEDIRRQLEMSGAVIGQLASQAELLERMARLVIDSYRAGKKLLLCGNGGSAGDAQHVATELLGRYKLERRALPAIPLGTDVTYITAVSNDYAFVDVFTRQIEGLGQPGDVLWAFSTSGSSKNVLAALSHARQAGLKTIGFTGSHGQAMAKLCDLCLTVPSNDTPRIQEAHIAAAHVICDLIERAFAS